MARRYVGCVQLSSVCVPCHGKKFSKSYLDIPCETKGAFCSTKKSENFENRNKCCGNFLKSEPFNRKFRQFLEESQMEGKYLMRNFDIPRKVVLFSRNPGKCCSTGIVTGNFREFNDVSKTEKDTLCSLSTSSPGPSPRRFSKWRLVGRRPWSRLGHVV